MFPDLYSMRDYAQKTHLLAAKWGIGTAKMELWRAHSNFIEEIIDNVAFKSHSRAVKELKTYFGGEEVLSKTQSKAAKRIIREASKPQAMAYSQQFQGNPWMPSSFLPPPMMGMNSQFFPQPPYQMTQPPMGPPGVFAGTCYKCNQQGHMARNCPTTMRRNPSQGGGARGPFRGRSFRRGRG